MSYLGQVQNLDWVSPSRIFATTVELFDSQPNYEHEVAIALDTNIKYQGIAPVVGGWGFANGAPGPSFPPVPPPVNDEFTKVLLEFDGKEGSTTYHDTNAAGWPRIWKTQGGFGSITTVGELFRPGALRLDGKTVITAPDENRFDFAAGNFTVRGYFTADFPLGIRRTLVSKTSQDGRFVFFVDRLEDGRIVTREGTFEPPTANLWDRNSIQIVDRAGESIFTRFAVFVIPHDHDLMSTTTYSDTVNPGWHELKYTRVGPTLFLTMDGVVEDTMDVNGEIVFAYPGPLTIGGYGPPINGVYQGNPWIGGLDRFAIDIGIAR